MKFRGIVVVVFGLGVGAVCGQLARAQNPSGPPANPLSARFAEAAARALRAIETDAGSSPLPRDNRGPASPLIEAADEEAESPEEHDAAQLLRLMYAQKRADNAHAETIQAEPNVNKPGQRPPVIPSAVNAGAARSQRACFVAVESLLQSKRFDSMPGGCETWIGPAAMAGRHLASQPQTSRVSTPSAASPSQTSQQTASSASAPPQASQTSTPTSAPTPPAAPGQGTSGSSAGTFATRDSITIQRGFTPPANASPVYSPVIEIPRQAPLPSQASEPPAASPSSEQRRESAPQRKARAKESATASDEPRPGALSPVVHSRPKMSSADFLRKVPILAGLLLAGIVVLLLIRVLKGLGRKSLQGRLVIERAGHTVADVEFRDLATKYFEVRETSHSTMLSRAEIAIATGSDIRLLALTMCRVDRKWQPFVTPIDSTLLLDGSRITETELMPSSQSLVVLGRHIKVIHYY